VAPTTMRRQKSSAWPSTSENYRRSSENFSSETVRKGCEQRSDREFGWYTQSEMSRKGLFRQSVELRRRFVRDFSDSFSRQLGEWKRECALPVLLGRGRTPGSVSTL